MWLQMMVTSPFQSKRPNIWKSKNMLLCFVMLLMAALQGCDQRHAQFIIVNFKQFNTNIFLADQSNPETLKYIGGDLHHTYNTEKSTITVEGSGVINYFNTKIEISATSIIIDGKKLDIDPKIVNNYVIKSDGELKSGFIRNFK